jgi:hypothetical protein
MKIVTCITDTEHIGYKYGLYASCKHHNLELVTLIKDDKEWKSHRIKDNSLKKYLEKLQPDEIVLFSDGYDTLFIGNEDEILERYEKVTDYKTVLIAAEINCYPASLFAEKYPKVEGPYKYVNSGGFIGRIEQIVQLLDDIENINLWAEDFDEKIFEWSNQYLWTWAYLKQRQHITLDTNCVLFQCFSVDTTTSQQQLSLVNQKRQIKSFTIKKMDEILENFTVKKDEVYNKITQSYPIHLHFNTPITKFGMFRKPFIKIIEKMN